MVSVIVLPVVAVEAAAAARAEYLSIPLITPPIDKFFHKVLKRYYLSKNFREC